RAECQGLRAPSPHQCGQSIRSGPDPKPELRENHGIGCSNRFLIFNNEDRLLQIWHSRSDQRHLRRYTVSMSVLHLKCWSILNALRGVFSMEDVARRVELGPFT